MTFMRVGFRASIELTVILVITCTIGWFFLAPNATGLSDNNETIVANTYRAFSGLSTVYRLGGDAPTLVSKLNQALKSLEEARVLRTQGDAVKADELETQARQLVDDVLNQIPASLQAANELSRIKQSLVFALVPLIVAIATFMFYMGLRLWRSYHRAVLFAMEIVDNEPED